MIITRNFAVYYSKFLSEESRKPKFFHEKRCSFVRRDVEDRKKVMFR